jgi:Leucine-rich repeat (LRR) protein
MRLDASVSQFTEDPINFRLRVEGDLLLAERRAVLPDVTHRLSKENFTELVELAESNKTASLVLRQIRSLELKEEGVDTSIARAVIDLFRSKEVELERLDRGLIGWCEEKIGEEEYQSRVLAARKIRNAFISRQPALDLSQMNLSSLPSELGLFLQLTELKLHQNRIERLPEEIARLTRLKKINLNLNPLREFPLVLTQLSRIEEISLSETGIENLPIEIGRLENLIQIDLSGNFLSDLPVEIENCKALKHLFLRWNRFRFIPDVVFRLSNLTYLHFGHNEIEILPKEIRSLSKLKRLNIENNHIAEIPLDLTGLPTLIEFHIDHNLLRAIPREIRGLVNLTTFTFSENPIENEEVLALGFIPEKSSDRSLLQEILLWFRRFIETEKFSPFSGSFDDYFAPLTSHRLQGALKTFLHRLEKIRDFEVRETRPNVISSLIDQLLLAAKNEVFRERYFELAADALERCDDRIAIFFNEMGVLASISSLDRLSDDQVALRILQAARKQILDEYAYSRLREKRPDENDQVEDFLYFYTALKEPLQLPGPVLSLKYTFAVKIREGEIELARRHVLAKTSTIPQLIEILSKDEVWKNYLRTNYSSSFERINEAISDQITSVMSDSSLSEGVLMEIVRELQLRQEQETKELIEEHTRAVVEKIASVFI